jgi:hypothetical protein
MSLDGHHESRNQEETAVAHGLNFAAKAKAVEPIAASRRGNHFQPVTAFRDLFSVAAE